MAIRLSETQIRMQWIINERYDEKQQVIPMLFIDKYAGILYDFHVREINTHLFL